MKPPSPRRALRPAVALAVLSSLSMFVPHHAHAATIDPNLSYYVPQVGPLATPTEGTGATRFFRVCPNNDGGSSLPNGARIKVVLHDPLDTPIAGVPAAVICVLFNGGTPAQGFVGPGADSVIANSAFNPTLHCPDLRCIQADGPTDASGTTYIYFSGFGGTLDQNRRWGHYDPNVPVFADGVQLKGRLTTPSTLGSYQLDIRNFDSVGGLTVALDQGERVTVIDWNPVVANLGMAAIGINYWRDFDGTGFVSIGDVNIVTAHLGHTCRNPLP